MRFSRGIDGFTSVCTELVTIIHANWHIAASVYGARRSLHVYQDFPSHHEETLKALAIELAANFRVLDEHMEDSPAYLNLKKEVELVTTGKFLQPTSGEMTLRDCANKVIHATSYEFRMGGFTTHDPNTRKVYDNVCKDAEIVVKGDLKGGGWECQVNLLTFAENIHEVFSRWVSGQFVRM